MAALGRSVGAFVRRLRAALKRTAYSGFRRDAWQQPDRVLDALELTAGDRVADLGAGGGYFTPRLADTVGSAGMVYAVDTDPDMLADLRRSLGDRSNVTVVRAHPGDPGLPAAVDLVLLVNTYHHLPEPVAYLRGLAAHLRPGGRVAVVEARVKGLRRLFGHATPPEEIRTALQAAGYALAAEHGFLVGQSLTIARRPESGAE